MKQTRITYKQGEEWLYEYIHSHSSPCGWIKDIIKREYNSEVNGSTKPDTQINNQISSMFGDF